MNSKYAEPRIIYKESKEKGFRIGRFHIMSMKKQTAWYCSRCDFILIDVILNIIYMISKTICLKQLLV